jgi:TPP-dependent pyruvate/acetoin dehydrogenase alpha subunit
MSVKDLNSELYRKMYLIRKVEEKICEHYPEDEMKTPVHLSIGEEAISAGVCTALGPESQVFGTYRSHGIYLAKTGETDKFFAELYGKETGLAKGKAGSMHLSAPEAGFLGTSAIVGSIIPVAVGAAFANKMEGNGKVVAVFFGDGAVDEGAFWESLNVACLMKLPVLFVCEDNDLAVHTHKSFRHGYHSITDIVSQFDCNVLKDETTDVAVIYKLTTDAMRLINETQKPCFLYSKYYRYREHVGVYEDFDCGYRSREEFEEWYKVDPLHLHRKKLLELYCSEEEIKKIENAVDAQVEKSIDLAKKASLPKNYELYKGVYS